jgi:hypothetical protein
MTFTRFSSLSLVLILAACGGDDDDDGDINFADSAPTVDSDPSPDAPPSVEGCDYTEADDAGNSMEPETTPLAVAAGAPGPVVCGAIDPAFQVEGENPAADVDAYEFTVEGVEGDRIPYRIVLGAAGGADLAGFGMAIYFVTDEGLQPVDGADYVNGYGLATNGFLIPGTFLLVVAAGADPLPAAAVNYKVELGQRLPCEAAAGEPNFVEANDGGTNRRNDMVRWSWTGDPPGTITGPTTDNPEPTALTLAPDTAIHLRGDSAAVTSPDDYVDRDSFLVTSGADVNEIDIRLTWPDGDVDMDVLVMIPTEENPVEEISGGGGTIIGTTADELFTVRVPPGGDLWLWAGTYDDPDITLPVTYDMTVCPRNFSAEE